MSIPIVHIIYRIYILLTHVLILIYLLFYESKTFILIREHRVYEIHILLWKLRK